MCLSQGVTFGSFSVRMGYVYHIHGYVMELRTVHLAKMRLSPFVVRITCEVVLGCYFVNEQWFCLNVKLWNVLKFTHMHTHTYCFTTFVLHDIETRRFILHCLCVFFVISTFKKLLFSLNLRIEKKLLDSFAPLLAQIKSSEECKMSPQSNTSTLLLSTFISFTYTLWSTLYLVN